MKEVIAATVAKLTPLYLEDGEDSPMRLLANSPQPQQAIKAQKIFLSVMLPGKFSSSALPEASFPQYLQQSLEQGSEILRPEIVRAIPFRWLGAADRGENSVVKVDPEKESDKVLGSFLSSLSKVRKLIIDDIQAAYNGDPAALSFAEVQLAYPGLLAIASHRLAHELYKLNVPIIPRIISEWIHTETGVDIHPGAKIDKGFFIDHATGVVIGETTTIGSNVKLYQGVTLGAKSFPLDANGNPIKHVQRHPTVEDDVVIYANATILGGDTVIGKGAVIGGNVFLTESVAAGSIIKYPGIKN